MSRAPAQARPKGSPGGGAGTAEHAGPVRSRGSRAGAVTGGAQRLHRVDARVGSVASVVRRSVFGRWSCRSSRVPKPATRTAIVGAPARAAFAQSARLARMCSVGRSARRPATPPDRLARSPAAAARRAPPRTIRRTVRFGYGVRPTSAASRPSSRSRSAGSAPNSEQEWASVKIRHPSVRKYDDSVRTHTTGLPVTDRTFCATAATYRRLVA